MEDHSHSQLTNFTRERRSELEVSVFSAIGTVLSESTFFQTCFLSLSIPGHPHEALHFLGSLFIRIQQSIDFGLSAYKAVQERIGMDGDIFAEDLQKLIAENIMNMNPIVYPDCALARNAKLRHVFAHNQIIQFGISNDLGREKLEKATNYPPLAVDGHTIIQQEELILYNVKKVDRDTHDIDFYVKGNFREITRIMLETLCRVATYLEHLGYIKFGRSRLEQELIPLMKAEAKLEKPSPILDDLKKLVPENTWKNYQS